MDKMLPHLFSLKSLMASKDTPNRATSTGTRAYIWLKLLKFKIIHAKAFSGLRLSTVDSVKGDVYSEINAPVLRTVLPKFAVRRARG